MSKVLTVDELLSSVAANCLAIQTQKKSELRDLKVAEQVEAALHSLGLIRQQLGTSLLEEKTLSLTRLLDEHPEKWNGPCECRLCLSYGD